MKKSAGNRLHDSAHDIRPICIMECREEYDVIMKRLRTALITLSKAGLHEQEFRRLSEIACMKAIKEVKDTGSEPEGQVRRWLSDRRRPVATNDCVGRHSASEGKN